MSFPNNDGLILDVRDRLARIEVKIDNTNEKLRDHDDRITQNSEEIAELKGEVVAHKAKMATYAKALTALFAAGGLVSWLVDHAGTVASVASAAAH